MRIITTRALSALGFSLLFSLTAACGGNKQEAKSPSSDTSDATRDGSLSPDPASDGTSTTSTTSSSAPSTPTEPIKTSAVSSTANGSDIIPPFSSGSSAATATKDSPKKTKAAKKGAKKKKPTDKTASN